MARNEPGGPMCPPVLTAAVCAALTLRSRRISPYSRQYGQGFAAALAKMLVQPGAFPVPELRKPGCGTCATGKNRSIGDIRYPGGLGVGWSPGTPPPAAGIERYVGLRGHLDGRQLRDTLSTNCRPGHAAADVIGAGLAMCPRSS